MKITLRNQLRNQCFFGHRSSLFPRAFLTGLVRVCLDLLAGTSFSFFPGPGHHRGPCWRVSYPPSSGRASISLVTHAVFFLMLILYVCQCVVVSLDDVSIPLQKSLTHLLCDWMNTLLCIMCSKCSTDHSHPYVWRACSYSVVVGQQSIPYNTTGQCMVCEDSQSSRWGYLKDVYLPNVRT